MCLIKWDAFADPPPDVPSPPPQPVTKRTQAIPAKKKVEVLYIAKYVYRNIQPAFDPKVQLKDNAAGLLARAGPASLPVPVTRNSGQECARTVIDGTYSYGYSAGFAPVFPF